MKYIQKPNPVEVYTFEDLIHHSQLQDQGKLEGKLPVLFEYKGQHFLCSMKDRIRMKSGEVDFAELIEKRGALQFTCDMVLLDNASSLYVLSKSIFEADFIPYVETA